MITLPNPLLQRKTIILEPGFSVDFIICSCEKTISTIENSHYSLLEFVTPVKITCNNDIVQITRQFMASNLQNYTIETPIIPKNLQFMIISFSYDWVNTNGLTKYFELNTFPSPIFHLPLFFNMKSVKTLNFFKNDNSPITNPFSIKSTLWNFIYNYLNMLQPSKNLDSIELKLEWIIENYLINLERPLPTLPEISLQLKISPSKLNQISKNKYGKPFYQYYRVRRMARSLEWLESGKYNVTTVSKKLGYSHPTKFIQEFKKHFGETPSKYIRFIRFNHFF